jgi:hypothetical protein
MILSSSQSAEDGAFFFEAAVSQEPGLPVKQDDIGGISTTSETISGK